VWIEKTVALKAAKAGSRNQGVGVTKHVSVDRFFSTAISAPLASKLPVESFKGFALWGQLILIPFDGLQDKGRVHRLEVHA